MSENKLDFIRVRRIDYNRFNVRFRYKNRVHKEYNISSFRMNRFLDFISNNIKSFYTYPYIDRGTIALEIGRK